MVTVESRRQTFSLSAAELWTVGESIVTVVLVRGVGDGSFDRAAFLGAVERCRIAA